MGQPSDTGRDTRGLGGRRPTRLLAESGGVVEAGGGTLTGAEPPSVPVKWWRKVVVWWRQGGCGGVVAGRQWGRGPTAVTVTLPL